MLYPYNNYLKYLLLVGKDVENIISHIKAIGYIPPNEEYIGWFLSTQMTYANEAKKVADPTDTKAFTAIADKVGVLSMYLFKKGELVEEAKAAMTGCTIILGDGHIRDIVEAMLLRGFKDKEIAASVAGNDIADLGEESIHLYKYYFWDTEGVDRLDWKTYLDKISDKREKYLKVLSIYGRPEYVKWKLGLKPKITYADVLEDMMNNLYFRFTEMVTSEDIGNVVKASKMADIVCKLGEKLNEYKKDTSVGFAAELQQNIEFLDTEVKNLQDLLEEEKK